MLPFENKAVVRFPYVDRAMCNMLDVKKPSKDLLQNSNESKLVRKGTVTTLYSQLEFGGRRRFPLTLQGSRKTSPALSFRYLQGQRKLC